MSGDSYRLMRLQLGAVMARFIKLRHNCAKATQTAPKTMRTDPTLLLDIQSNNGLSLAELQTKHPQIARRSLQRQIGELITRGVILATGNGRARRYFASTGHSSIKQYTKGSATPVNTGQFPDYIPQSPDSKDIVAYINQPVAARKPVGYQLEFLTAYQANKTFYLSDSLRRQLHKMGRTTQEPLPAGTYSRAILNRLLIDLSWASSHLEGNTYSRLDTVELIEHGKIAQGKATLETQMILNHKNAIELLVSNSDTAEFNHYTLMNLHSALAENLLPNPADEGRIRMHAVDISKSVYRPLSTPQQLQTALDVFLAKAQAISDPFEQSFFVMVHLPYLQPFADINKRTSRLAANLPLFRANLCPLTFLDVPEQAYSCATLGIYELTRVELLRDLYVWAYERSTQEYLAIKQELAEPDPARLVWRELIKNTIKHIITHPELVPMTYIQNTVLAVPDAERANVQALIIEELRRLHEGVLARYGLRPSELKRWREAPSKE
jgi:hypothetical protein